MSYRVEVAKTGRAGCTDKVCKDQGIKILKGELRLGSWLEMPDGGHGSWKWRHWGCTSGLVIQNIREKIDNGDGDYDFDAVDGYDELGEHPDIQKKIRRVIMQGHIDPEDFNGDPEFNKLGLRGIRGRKKKNAAKDDDEEDADDKPAKGDTTKTSTSTKRGRKEADDDAEPPTKKVATGTKAKKGAKKAEPAEEPEPPTKATRTKGKKVVKDEAPASEELEDEAPKTRARKARGSSSKQAVSDAKGAKRRGRKNAA